MAKDPRENMLLDEAMSRVAFRLDKLHSDVVEDLRANPLLDQVFKTTARIDKKLSKEHGVMPAGGQGGGKGPSYPLVAGASSGPFNDGGSFLPQPKSQMLYPQILPASGGARQPDDQRGLLEKLRDLLRDYCDLLEKINKLLREQIELSKRQGLASSLPIPVTSPASVGGPSGQTDPYKDIRKKLLGQHLDEIIKFNKLGAAAASGDAGAAAKLGPARAGLAIGGLGVATGGMGQLAQSQRTEGILGGGSQVAIGAGMTIAALGGVGGPIGLAIASIGVLGLAAAEAVGKLRQWGDSLLAADLKFSEFSAAMAQVAAQHEVRQIGITMERGERRATAAGELAEAKDRLDRALAPLEDKWSIFIDGIAATSLDRLTDIAEFTKKILLLLNIKLEEKAEPEGVAPFGTNNNLWFENQGVGVRWRNELPLQ